MVFQQETMSRMTAKKSLASLIMVSGLVAMALGLSTPTADAVPSGKDYNRVINLSGKQRMLTQKMSKESMLIALGVGVEENIKNLETTRNLFDRTLKGLRNGDNELGLPETKKPTILKALSQVDELWSDFDPAIQASIANGKVEPDQVATIAQLNLPLLKAMNKTVKFYEAEASSSGVNSALAVAINLSGRQRMLTQKMSKEFLLVVYGYEVEKNKESLKQTSELFDRTLKGLIQGDVELGLSPAPTPEIKAQLDKVQQLWTNFSPLMKRAADGSAITSEQVQQVAAQNLPLLKEMNTAVGLFENL